MDSAINTANKKIDMTNIPEDLVFGLDIGTRSIVGTVGYKNSTNGFVVVAQVAVEHETRAMIDGQIHDIGQVARTIEQIRLKLEDMTGRKFKEVCIAAAGRVLKTMEATADMHFDTDTIVTSEHIYSLNMLAVEHAYDSLRGDLQSDDTKFYCVGYSVKQYYQNEYPISNLEGHKCTNIRTELIATFLPDEVVDGLYAAVERAGLYVANLTLEPIAAINVAIPEKFRLLNIALVDVGAGTSDISITRDGSIIAYGMIPYAGDEVTEAIAKKYLTDFTEADRMKCSSTTQEEVEYHDIMGLPQKISSEELVASVEDTVKMITKNVSDRIIELNGGKPVSAIFVVGGGGKIGGFVESLAEYQGIQKERVALRGSEVLANVTFLQDDITVDSLLVTPVGICLNYYEQRNNFIFVTVNDERIKLYDNNKLTIMDAAMQIGFPNEELFPKRGDSITYYVEGDKRMLRGEAGEAAVIHLNGKETGINTPIALNDRIEIKPSTKGVNAELTVGKLPEYKASISFLFNGKNVTCPRFVSVNGELVSEFYQIQDEDRISILDFYTLQQVLEFMDIIDYENVLVNNMPADMNTKVYDNFTIVCDMKEQVPEKQEEPKEEVTPQTEPQSVLSAEPEQAAEAQSVLSARPQTESQATLSARPQPRQEVETKRVAEGVHNITITVNGDTVIMRNKANYILVDVLDFYPVDTSVAHGERLETLVNGVPCDFTYPIHENDRVSIRWV
ncbi:MAG: cell division FtsA domain-containing protein [Butyribacter sp.]|nr:cell division FtsA domain-containing protein [bacterium]MDY3854957.1 cell division FtsA domain-containing protein [Butyribacter sp.]